MNPETPVFILNTLADSSKHFLLAFSVGALVFSLTSTTWSVSSLVYRLLTHRKVSTAVDCGMFICCLLLALSAALASHWALDYFATWYITPFNGAPLELINP